MRKRMVSLCTAHLLGANSLTSPSFIADCRPEVQLPCGSDKVYGCGQRLQVGMPLRGSWLHTFANPRGLRAEFAAFSYSNFFEVKYSLSKTCTRTKPSSPPVTKPLPSRRQANVFNGPKWALIVPISSL